MNTVVNKRSCLKQERLTPEVGPYMYCVIYTPASTHNPQHTHLTHAKIKPYNFAEIASAVPLY